MGILDSKSRIMDAILTSEGRRQMAEGTFSVKFATFSDTDVGYKSDSENGHIEPAGKIFLEASSLPQDQIVYEANDEGNVVSFRDDRIVLDQINSVPLLIKPLEIFFSQGKPSAFQLNYGARLEIRKPGIDPAILGNVLNSKVFSGTGIGFSITDSTKRKADFILDPDRVVNTVSSSYANAIIASSSYYIGIKGGINARDLTTLIQSTITSASLVGSTYLGGKSPGPHIESVDRENYIYVTDVSGSHDKIVIQKLLGAGPFVLDPDSITYPFVIEDATLGGRKDRFELPNADFASQIKDILTSSFDNFQDLRILSTIDPVFQEDSFQIFPNEITFDINQLSNKNLISQKPTLNSLDSLFSDEKLSNTINFKYLPPIVKTSDTVLPDKTDFEKTLNYQLATYKPLGPNTKPITYEKFLKDVNSFGSNGLKKLINFEKTTRSNNLLCQIFEISNGSVQKLDIIDYGFINQGPGSVLEKRVYYVGKVYLDNRGTSCFLNMFTIVFSQDAGEEG